MINPLINLSISNWSTKRGNWFLITISEVCHLKNHVSEKKTIKCGAEMTKYHAEKIVQRIMKYTVGQKKMLNMVQKNIKYAEKLNKVKRICWMRYKTYVVEKILNIVQKNSLSMMVKKKIINMKFSFTSIYEI